MKPPHFNGRLFTHGRERLTHSERGNILPPKQGSDSGGAPQSDESGILFSLFPGPKEGRLSPPYLGPSCVEQTLEDIQFQNANSWLARPRHKTERLVHIGQLVARSPAP